MKQLLALTLALLLLLAACGKPGTKKTNPSDQEGAASSAETLADQNRFLGGYGYQTARIGDVLYFSDWGAPNGA